MSIQLTRSRKCAIPVLEGLLPEPHNSAVLRLLFICAHWHGMAKLRMHTDHTLKIFDQLTARIGAEFRTFNNKTCPAFKTQELGREVNARKRRQLKKTGTKGKSTAASAPPTVENGDDEEGPLPKNFNIQTYKHHALGDYPSMIRRFGTTDSYSTEPVSISAAAVNPNIDVNFYYRQSSSTARQRLGILVRIESNLSNSSLKLSAVRFDFVVFEPSFLVQQANVKKFPNRGKNITIWVSQRIIPFI